MSALSHVAITVRLHDDRYHGMGETHPSPARIFQALVAAAAPVRSEHATAALRWLEELEPPVICVPYMKRGQEFDNFVPNNDTDTLGGDLRRVDEIRASKAIAPKLLPRNSSFSFLWQFEPTPASTEFAKSIMHIVERIYQFGRGVDMAWATAQLTDEVGAKQIIADHFGQILHPSGGTSERALRCPERGTLASLDARHEANIARFIASGEKQLFAQASKPRFRQIAYASPPARQTYELRQVEVDTDVLSVSAKFDFWASHRVTALVTWIRDAAAGKLRKAFPERVEDVERCLIGRRPDGAHDGPKAARIRIIPLPSIGSSYADRAIRRLVVEVPGECPFRAEDVFWAFTGSPVADPTTGVVSGLLVPAEDETMAQHYGIGTRTTYLTWHTVTPVALPDSARRRRIDPRRQRAEAKGGTERLGEEGRAARAVLVALDHARVRERVTRVRVQREPFEGRGERAERFAEGSRFEKERLWHVEVVFERPVAGPLVLGDGRYLGLGLLAPSRDDNDFFAFDIVSGLEPNAQPRDITHALRRAVMSRVQDRIGPRASLPAMFSGHEDADGSKVKDAHVAFAFEATSSRLYVIVPPTKEERKARTNHLRILREALEDFAELRAGAAGLLALRPHPIDRATDPVLGHSRVWTSVTPYAVLRHSNSGAEATFLADLKAQLAQAGLPGAKIAFRELRGIRGEGLIGHATVEFAVAVPGPILLGRTRFVGGGLFRAVRNDP